MIPALQWNINNAKTSATDCSRHEFLFGFRLPGPSGRATSTAAPVDVKCLREHFRKEAQLATDIAASEMKRIYDERHRHEEFEVGDKVWLRMGTAYKPRGGVVNNKTAPSAKARIPSKPRCRLWRTGSTYLRTAAGFTQ